MWVADEHVTAAALAQVQPRADLYVVTNRCDVAAHCAQRGIRVATNDFRLGDQQYAAIFFRVAKEKAVVHHVINQALDVLAVGGTLWLAGDKNDGIKTYLDKAATRAGTAASLQRDGASLLGAVQRAAQLGELLPDQNYAELRRIEFSEHFSAWSKPGIFGWQKIDAGSAFLIEHLQDVFPSEKGQTPARVLDLGCGYGYLSMSAARQWPSAELVASDNNATAVAACARNFSELAIRGEVICSDCGAVLVEKFSAILCNPPFHQGFDVDAELTARFLRNTRRLLARGGRALFVVNQFIALERAATPLFARVDVVARNKSFKLVVLEA